MAELNAKKRNALPDSAFAIVRTLPDGTKERKYPIDARARGANALARVAQNGTPGEKVVVRRAVCRRYSDLPECHSCGHGRSSPGR